MSTTSTDPSPKRDRAPPSLRLLLALAFGVLAGALAGALSLAIGHDASQAARVEISRHLTRLAIEYRGKLEVEVTRGSERPDLAAAEKARADIEGSETGAPFELLLAQADGTVLAGPAALLGKKVPLPLGAHVGAPAAIERWPDGEDYLAGGSTSRGAGGVGGGNSPGWVTIARQRVAVAFAPVVELQRAILWAGLALALAGIGIGWLLATRLARPLESLAAAAERIAAGEHRAALPRPRDYGELARLSEALRAMLAHLREQSESLRDAQDRMEQRVRERTAELVKLQAQLELEVADTMTARDDVALANERLALALDSSSLALWDFDVASDRVYLSASWAQMLGGAPAESRVPSAELAALIPERERARVTEAVRAAVAGGGGTEYRVEHPVTRRDGSMIWIMSVGRVVERDAEGRALRIIGTNRDITERIQQAQALQASEERFHRLADLYADWYWELDAEFRYTRIEGDGLAAIGLSAASLIGRSPHEALRYRMISISQDEFDRLRAARASYRDLLGSLRAPSGRLIYLTFSGEPTFGPDGEFRGYHGAARNVTAQVQAQQAQREADERFRIAFDSAAVGMALVAPEGQYLRVNRALCELLGYSEAELLQSDVRRVSHPEDISGFAERMSEIIAGTRNRYQIEKRYLRKDGSIVWAQLDSALIRDAQGQPLQFFSQVQDITERRAAQQKVEEMAMHDALTGLPNKRLLADRLAQALAAARRGGQPVGLLYFDLDGFKPVNDRLGHAAGDSLLREVARRGRAALRDADTLARIGGDEFVVVLPGAGAEALRRAAERLREAVAGDYSLAGGSAKIGASVGAALASTGDENPDSLMDRADAAMYEAKRAGRNTIRFAPELNDTKEKRP